MKLYTVVVHNLQMCMKEYRCCLKFREGEIIQLILSRKGGSCTKPGHHAVTSFTKPGPAILTWPMSFTLCLHISIIKSTKWRFLSSLFINLSFNTFRSIQCEQFRETEQNLGLGSSWSSFCGTLSLISQLIYDDIAKMFHLTGGNG